MSEEHGPHPRPAEYAAFEALGSAPGVGADHRVGWSRRTRLLVAVLAVAVVGGVVLLACGHTRAPIVTTLPTPSAPAKRTFPPADQPPSSAVPAISVELFDQDVALSVPGDAVVWAAGPGHEVVTSSLLLLDIQRWPVGRQHNISSSFAVPDGSNEGDILAAVTAWLASQPSPHTYAREDRQVDNRTAYEWVARAALGAPADHAPIGVWFAVDNDTAYLFTGSFLGIGTATYALIQYESALRSTDFLAPYTATALGGRISFTIDGALRIRTNLPDQFEVDPGSGTLLGVGPVVRIVHGTLGTRIALGQLSMDSQAGTIGGASLGKLTASMNQIVSLETDHIGPRNTVLGGLPAFVWSYRYRLPSGFDVFGPQTAMITLVVHGQDVYVFFGDTLQLANLAFLP